MTYRATSEVNETTKVVISIYSRLLADGIRALLSDCGYQVELHSKQASFDDIYNDLNVTSDRRDTIWILDLKTLLGVVPASRREMIQKRTVLIADAHLGKKSQSYLSEAAAIVCAESSFQELEFALRAVNQGNRYVDQSLSHFRMEEFNGTTPNLTTRQLQVLRMVADGMSSRKIANELLLSRRTVENHRARILERLGASSAAEMIDIAKNRNWI